MQNIFLLFFIFMSSCAKPNTVRMDAATPNSLLHQHDSNLPDSTTGSIGSSASTSGTSASTAGSSASTGGSSTTTGGSSASTSGSATTSGTASSSGSSSTSSSSSGNDFPPGFNDPNEVVSNCPLGPDPTITDPNNFMPMVSQNIDPNTGAFSLNWSPVSWQSSDLNCPVIQASYNINEFSDMNMTSLFVPTQNTSESNFGVIDEGDYFTVQSVIGSYISNISGPIHPQDKLDNTCNQLPTDLGSISPNASSTCTSQNSCSINWNQVLWTLPSFCPQISAQYLINEYYDAGLSKVKFSNIVVNDSNNPTYNILPSEIGNYFNVKSKFGTVTSTPSVTLNPKPPVGINCLPTGVLIIPNATTLCDTSTCQTTWPAVANFSKTGCTSVPPSYYTLSKYTDPSLPPVSKSVIFPSGSNSLAIPVDPNYYYSVSTTMEGVTSPNSTPIYALLKPNPIPTIPCLTKPPAGTILPGPTLTPSACATADNCSLSWNQISWQQSTNPNCLPKYADDSTYVEYSDAGLTHIVSQNDNGSSLSLSNVTPGHYYTVGESILGFPIPKSTIKIPCAFSLNPTDPNLIPIVSPVCTSTTCSIQWNAIPNWFQSTACPASTSVTGYNITAYSDSALTKVVGTPTIVSSSITTYPAVAKMYYVVSTNFAGGITTNNSLPARPLLQCPNTATSDPSQWVPHASLNRHGSSPCTLDWGSITCASYYRIFSWTDSHKTTGAGAWNKTQTSIQVVPGNVYSLYTNMQGVVDSYTPEKAYMDTISIPSNCPSF